MKKVCYIVFALLLCVSCKHKVQTDVIDTLMLAAIDSGRIPGGVVCVVEDTGIVYLKAYGYRQLVGVDSNGIVVPDTLPMTIETAFDLASLTKVVATTWAVLRLAQDSAIDLNSAVIGDSVAWVHLLTHTSGIQPYLNAKRMERAFGAGNRQALQDTLVATPRKYTAGTDRMYSCLNFIRLQGLVEELTATSFDVYCREKVFEPLGMMQTTFVPQYDNIAATEIIPDESKVSSQKYRRKSPLQRGPRTSPCLLGCQIMEGQGGGCDSILLCGEVHDPLARVMNAGVSGNAGCFSTATDLAKMAQYILTNPEDTLVRLISHVPDSLPFGRTMGWEKPDSVMSYMGTYPDPCMFGHTGYTGTCIVISPIHKRTLILLTNRAHPYDKGRLGPLRRLISDAVFGTGAK